MTPLLHFSHEMGTIRTVEIDGEPWFVGKDVAEILGYGNGNAKSKALANAIATHVEEDEKFKMSAREFKELRNSDLEKVSNYGMILVNESGLYSLILGSTLPTARVFRKWVTKEVLPTIRKRGFYCTPSKAEEMCNDPDKWIELFENYKKEQQSSSELTIK